MAGMSRMAPAFTRLSALLVVVMSTAVDILYGVVDPRVRFH